MKMKDTEVQMEDANPDKLHENCNLNDNNTNSSEVKSTELVQGKEKKKGKKKKKSPIAENCTNSKGEAIAENCTELQVEAIAENCTKLQGKAIAENCTELQKKKKKKIKVGSDNLEIESKSSQENCTNSKGDAIAENCTKLQEKKKKKIKVGSDNLEIESKSSQENCTETSTITETDTDLQVKKKKKKKKADNNLEAVDKNNNLEVDNNKNLEIDNRSTNIESKSSKENSISKEVVGTVSETGTDLPVKKKKKKKKADDKKNTNNNLEVDNNNNNNKLEIDNRNTNIESKLSKENSISNEKVVGTITETGTDLPVKKKKKKIDNNLEVDENNNNNLEVNDNSNLEIDNNTNIESKSSKEKSISKEEIVGKITETGTDLQVRKKKKKKKIDNNLEVDENNNNNLEVNDNVYLEIDNNNTCNANIESKLSEENSVSKEVGTVSETGTDLQAKKKKKKGEKCENYLDLDNNNLKADNTNTEADNINNNNDENNNTLNIESKSTQDNCNSKGETVGTVETGTEEITETGTDSQGNKRKRMKKKKSKINQEIVPKTRNSKLLVLDINGLLADINSDYKFADSADTKIRGKLVFKRPFCDEFLNFCFDNFEVGIWSSRMKHNVDEAVQFLMGNRKDNLLFCWDQSKCTATKFNTVENAEKPLVFKELRKIWEKEAPNLPWQKGEFGPNNTLLIDDSPYKALCNPPYTAIFPKPYSFKDKDDNSLGEGGDLRVYLEKLLTAQHMQYFVKDNPFGQPAITDSDPHWKYYIQIIDSLNKPFIKKF